MLLWDGTLKCEEKRQQEKQHLDLDTMFLVQEEHYLKFSLFVFSQLRIKQLK